MLSGSGTVGVSNMTENCDNPHRVNYITKRKQLLLDAFKKNQPVIFPLIQE